MKKRLISMLLSVLLVVSLFAGYSLSASADTVSYSTMKYTMQSGDYVLRICQRLGLNYYTCKVAIMKLNNIAENQWNKLPVGKVLTLPATDADAVVIATGKGSTLTANPVSAAATSTATASTTAANTSKTVTTNSKADTLIAQDKVVWYMIPYTLAKGETVNDACNALGIDFNSYKYAIQRVNNIKSWNNIPAGTSLWLASGSVPAGGTNCIAIYRHMMQSGETAYGVVTDRGLNYNSVKWLLEIVNEIYPDLASIKAGQRFDYPISTTVGLTSNQATGGSTTTTTTTTSSGTTVTTEQKYKLTSGIDTGAATVAFYVGDKKVTEAKAGDTVSVDINAKAGRALKSVVVKYANGQADLQLSSYSFTMPKCDVRIDAEFMKGYSITVESNYVGKVVTLVNGVSVNGAAAGASVMVSSVDPAYEIESISAFYKTLLGVKKEVTITSANGFVMPDNDVTVEVKLKPVTTYSFYVTDPLNGSFHLQVNGATVTKAAKGAQVTIVTNPLEGYSPSKIEVKEHDGSKTVSVLNNTFTMPGFDVDVTVEFDSKGNNIVVVPAQGGTVKAMYNGEEVTEAPTGKLVTLEAKDAQAGYTLDKVDVTRISDGLKVSVTKKSDGTFTFTMPSGGVIVTPIYKGAEKTLKAVVCIGDANTPAAAPANVILHVITDGVDTSVETTKDVSARYGNYVDLKPVSDATVMGFVEFVVEVDGAVDDELTNQANLKGYIQMPNKDVTVKAVFAKGYMAIGAAAITGKGTVSYFLADHDVSALYCQPGDEVTIVAAPAVNYNFLGKDSITVTRKDTGAKLTLKDTGAGYAFTMPAEGVNIQVTFDQVGFRAIMSTVDTAGNDLTGKSLWQINFNNMSVVENSQSNVHVPYGAKVTISLTEAGKSEYDLVKVKINDVEYTKSVNYPYSFVMNEETTIVATLRSKTPKPTEYSLQVTEDITKGTAEFVIYDSKYDYDHSHVKDVKTAHAGDTVAIVDGAFAAKGYKIDSDHITITKKDGGIIHPTKVTLNTGKTAYTFKMPDDGYSSIKVDYFGDPHKLTIKVVDKNGTDVTTYGMARIKFSGGNYNDVNSPDSIGLVEAGETVQALKSAPANSIGWEVDDITGVPSIADSKKDVQYGKSFVMPNEDLVLTIKMTGDASSVPTPTEITLPEKTDSNLNLLYYKEDGVTLITDRKVMSGDTVIVKIDEAATPIGDGKMLRDGIHFLDSSSGEAAMANNGGSFVVSSAIDGSKSPKAEVVTKQYAVRIRLQNVPGGANVTVDGNPVSDGTILSPNTEYGKELTIKTDSGKIAAVSGLTLSTSLPADTAKGNLKPDASVADGATVDVTVSFQKKYTLKVDLANADGATVKVEGQTVSASGTVIGEFVATDIINFTDASRDIVSVEGLGTYTPNDSKNGVANMKDAEGSELTATVTFKTAECALLSGKGVKYYKEEACTNELTGTVEKGTTVYVKADSLAVDEYAKSITMTADGKDTKLSGDAQPYTVSADISDVTVETAKKIVKVKLVCSGGPDSAECKISTDKTNWVSSQLSNLKAGDPVYVKAAFAKIQSVSEASGAFGTTLSKDNDTEASGTLKLTAAIKNGDTITLNVTLAEP